MCPIFVSYYVCMQNVTEICGHILGMSYTYQNKKKMSINMCPKTFNLSVIAERILCGHQEQHSINVWAWIVGAFLAYR
jgi:uncharacterized membrane protein